ncbi:hypothetical protein GCM10011375_06250 [Hymenobacter qilianensis]|uniref:Uncharacterized protein n=2 Tax=Hymenobacter qilianensis TaxID=1385715 RepID=A0A7H0GZL5_9BACT|nr:hypothetical protein [Hymenobacter qilianensis]QNP53731.1 hypothetical protein H9L05_09415 [Hymenobacter qilianensis]GGF53478.1 hypothetical protein GCM10011375_06250 [Hymenobacter qilianensis]
MFLKSKIPFIITLMLGIIIGFIISVAPDRFYLLSIESKISLGELSNILVTIILALIIPISINKWIDDNKSIKSLFSYEIDASLNSLKDIKDLIDICYDSGLAVQDGQKNKINFMFKVLDNRVAFMVERINSKYKQECQGVIADVNGKNNTYWVTVTNGELMTTGYIINSTFMRRHATAYVNLENALKRVKYELNEF